MSLQLFLSLSPILFSSFVFFSEPQANRALPDQDAVSWQWVHGALEDQEQQEDYLSVVKRVYEYYQGEGLMTGPLVAASTLEQSPKSPVVFVGPIQAFKNPEWFDLPIEVLDPSRIKLGGAEITTKSLGLYLRSENAQRVLYSGLSLQGFKNIFTVPTGSDACTLTQGQGDNAGLGNYVGGVLELQKPKFLTRYPSETELKAIELPEAAIEVVAFDPESEDMHLSYEALEWLEAFVESKRVLFVGEGHWSQGISDIFLEMIKSLADYPGVGTVFLELNYSFSGYYDHYVQIIDDEEAQDFVREWLHPLVSTPGTLELLDWLRGWNRENPKDPIHVATLDMEWNHSIVIEHLLRPCFRRIDESFNLPDPSSLDRKANDTLREETKRLLALAKEKSVDFGVEFLTPDYLDTVLTNLWDTFAIKDFQVDRQRSIIRNVSQFHAARIGEKLTVFRGGGWHAVKNPGQESFYREARYLHEVHPQTKGRVATLLVGPLGYCFENVHDWNPKTSLPSASKYRVFVRDFQAALRDGRATKSDYYLLEPELTVFDSLMAKIGNQRAKNLLLVDQVDWESLRSLHGKKALENRVQDYDAILYVLKSHLERTRPRQLGQ